MLDDITVQKSTKRISSIKGQINGIEKMIDERKYCMDIVHQITAARRALDSLAFVIMEQHVKSCVKDAYSDNDEIKADRKLDDLFTQINRFMK